jgi:two-component system chemotaxis sensor kinase CheA
MGLLSPSDAQGMTPRELYRLAWTPGLSTAERLSEVSGRGMGMDIVRSRVTELGGAVELESEPGRGTTVIIKLPLTLAILPSLMVETHGEVFALPLESVVEIVAVGRNDVTTVGGRPAARLRGRVLPIVTLEAVFNGSVPLLPWSSAGRTCQSLLGSRQAATHGGIEEGATLIVLGPPDRQIGLAADRVLGEEDVVVKSLAANYHNVAGIAGAGISGEGRVFLILDPTALTENLQEHEP